MQKEILRARAIPGNELLDKKRSQKKDTKLIFNVTCYPVFRYLRSQVKELRIILACHEKHEKVFPHPPVIDSRSNKNLNQIW